MKGFLLKNRPPIGSIALAILVALYSVFMFNRTFLTRIFEYFHHDYELIFIIVLGFSCLFIAVTVAISVKYLSKLFFIVLILIGSAASWFTDQFGTIIDKDMIANALETTTAEADNLITSDFIFHFFLTGIFPSLLILWVNIRHRPIISKILHNLAVIIPCLLILLFCILSTFRDLISTARQHEDLARIIHPFVPIRGVIRYVLDDTGRQPVVFQHIGLDARVIPTKDIRRNRVTIIVAGETARAENFSLGGYKRRTNPELEKRNVIYFSNVTSCGTATAKSVPCMFSVFRKNEYNEKTALMTDALPDVLSHAGIKTEWWENNTGSKGVSDRIKTVKFYGRDDPDFCINGECHDDIMLDALDQWLDNVQDDSVLFIHQLGSHGPSYYKRYPEKFRRFQPDCRRSEFSKCISEELYNAYDNTIVYTDYVLASIIDKLKARADKFDGAMIYMSDHGESLGENGLYLHGMPYALAPRQQIEIPFILWMSPAFSSSMALDRDCLKKGAAFMPLSHDNLFPSVLDMMNVQTTVKDESLNIFAACQHKYIASGK